MSFPALIAQFSEQAPIATMVRGLLANILSPTELNVIFRETAERQRESPLLFSTVVDLLSLVVSKAHAQERSLFVELVEPFAPGQLWIADRNFCTTLIIHEAVAQKACFLVRQHAGLTVQEAGRWQAAGRTDGGRLFEQPATVADGYGNEVVVRRIRLVLDEPTEDGTREIYLLTNLPPKVTAATVAELYGNRWSIERAFGELTLSLRGEIETLGYPRAALLAYAIALVMYNLMAVVKAALRVAHGAEQVQDKISFYYLANEVAGTWHGMEIAIPACHWDGRFAGLSPEQLAIQLKQIAGHAQLRCYRKHPRGPKKPSSKRRGTATHVSTARLIAQRRE